MAAEQTDLPDATVWRSPMDGPAHGTGWPRPMVADGDLGRTSIGLDAGLRTRLVVLPTGWRSMMSSHGRQGSRWASGTSWSSSDRLDGACAVDGLAQCVDDTADRCLPRPRGRTRHLAGVIMRQRVDGAALFDPDVGQPSRTMETVTGLLLRGSGPCRTTSPFSNWSSSPASQSLHPPLHFWRKQTAGDAACDAVAHQNDRADPSRSALLDDIFVMLDRGARMILEHQRSLVSRLHCCVFTTQFFVNFRWGRG